jgi:hypothetical protein
MDIIRGVSYTSLQGAQALIDEGAASKGDFWVFVGYAGWAPDQLQGAPARAVPHPVRGRAQLTCRRHGRAHLTATPLMRTRLPQARSTVTRGSSRLRMVACCSRSCCARAQSYHRPRRVSSRMVLTHGRSSCSPSGDARKSSAPPARSPTACFPSGFVCTCSPLAASRPSRCRPPAKTEKTTRPRR